MRVHIITDSGSDLNQNSLNNLTILPLKVTIDGKCYSDGVDMSKDEFYTMLENSDILPVTSLASPYEFEEVYDSIENDEAIVITVSSKVSGTYQSAMIAAQGRENIFVIDSKSVSFGQAGLVLRALKMAEDGMSAQKIVEEINRDVDHLRFFAVVDTLKYLEKGGRLSKGAALLGGIIGLKPILTFDDGALAAIGKARGSKSAYRNVVERMMSEKIDPDKPMFVAYSGTSSEKMDKFLLDNQTSLTPYLPKIQKAQLGSAVGTHAGPNTVVVSYFVQ